MLLETECKKGAKEETQFEERRLVAGSTGAIGPLRFRRTFPTRPPAPGPGPRNWPPTETHPGFDRAPPEEKKRAALHQTSGSILNRKLWYLHLCTDGRREGEITASRSFSYQTQQKDRAKTESVKH